MLDQSQAVIMEGIWEVLSVMLFLSQTGDTYEKDIWDILM